VTRRGRLSEDGRGLYVHLPFCTSKCRYCDFNSYAWNGQSLEAYVDALLLEAKRRANALNPQTVFFGGGTPSLLPPDLLAKLFDDLNNICGFRQSSLETSMEANPESLDLARATAMRDGGVNRLSIGIQSLQADVLQAYDRVHSPQQARDALAIAGELFPNFNADLIFAFPGQDPTIWQQDLKDVLSSQPTHLSCYELSYEPGTALTRLRDVGRWKSEDPDLCEQLFVQTGELCAAAGLERYEISNFCRPDHQCLHNLAAWRSLDFVGIGAGAAGSVNGVRRSNLARPEHYQEVVEAGGDPVHEQSNPDPQTLLFEHMMMGLRLVEEGVSRRRAIAQNGVDPWLELQPQLQQLHDRGLIHLINDEDGICTTKKGALLLDHILMQILPGTSV
jgi:putative oxygen-independent coproporphyrinogen III oxidase